MTHRDSEQPCTVDTRVLDDDALDGIVGGAPSHSQCEPDDGSGTGSSAPQFKRRPQLLVLSYSF